MTHVHPKEPLVPWTEPFNPHAIVETVLCNGRVVKCRGCGQDRCLTQCPERDCPDHCPEEADWLESRRSRFCCSAGATAYPEPCPWRGTHHGNEGPSYD